MLHIQKAKSHNEKEIFISKKERASFWGHTKSRKIIVADFTKRNLKKLFNNLNPSFVNDNKLFWKMVKPFFWNKGSSESNIKLEEKDQVLQDDKNIAEALNTFFKNVVSSLDINENSSITNQSFQNIDDPVDRAI